MVENKTRTYLVRFLPSAFRFPFFVVIVVVVVCSISSRGARSLAVRVFDVLPLPSAGDDVCFTFLGLEKDFRMFRNLLTFFLLFLARWCFACIFNLGVFFFFRRDKVRVRFRVVVVVFRRNDDGDEW